MSTPTLSIIVPAWNEEKYIGRTIDSLRRAAQVYERERGCVAEIIAVDNNSQDRTGDVAREHGALVVLEPVNNIGKARNAGVKVARGKYLAFCDADNQVPAGPDSRPSGRPEHRRRGHVDRTGTPQFQDQFLLFSLGHLRSRQRCRRGDDALPQSRF
jgi:hypothetical protein